MSLKDYKICKMLKRIFIFLAALALTVFLVSCQKPAVKQEAPAVQAESTSSANPVLVFDLGHSEIFSPDDAGPIGYRSFVTKFSDWDYKLVINHKSITREDLDNSHVLVISGAMKPFTDAEVDVIREYVAHGGNLIITVHVAYFLTNLVEEFGFELTSSPIAQEENQFGGSPKNFVATAVNSQAPVCQGVNGVAVQGSWGLRSIDKNAYVVVSTGPDAWADFNANDAYDEGEPQGSYGIVGIALYGDGKVVVVADDAVFNNSNLRVEGNNRLLENIATWFTGRTSGSKI